MNALSGKPSQVIVMLFYFFKVHIGHFPVVALAAR